MSKSQVAPRRVTSAAPSDFEISTTLADAETLACDLEGDAERVAALTQVLQAIEEHRIACERPAQAAVIRGALLRDLGRAGRQLLPRTRRLHTHLVALYRRGAP